ncbi:hypothetical protein KKF34_15630 [Myxococcota bacterium]|nr:hypothetical protein [Myxococcota bacterium]MBU1379591.1 hypothetical protein [Myxococcota bacterium]MBU1498306.1 hypothetical protein [Myxococcota bacterium]
MQPINIIKEIGKTKVVSIVDELNSGQFKRVLLRGDIPTRIPMSVVSLKARTQIWKDRLIEAVTSSNYGVAETLLYEWLLNRRRQLLIDYLDKLNIKHKKGETDETFLKTIPEETLRSKAKELMKDHSDQEVAIYVHFLDYHQQSRVFETDDFFVNALKEEKSE